MRTSAFGRWLLILGSVWSSCFQGGQARALERFAFEKAEMGVPVRVTLYAEDEEAARKAADAAFARVARLNAVFSDYDSDSELSQLAESSGQNRAVEVSEELWRVLEYAQHVARRSQGAFDLSVGPLVNLWRTARRKKVLPSGDKLEEARARVGYQFVHLDAGARRVLLEKPRMRLDAGGIAKGHAMEEALQVLRKQGHARAMVSGGGDMALGESPPGESGWRIEVVALDAQGAPAPRRLRLSNRCISTSGDLFQRLEIDGKRYSHIVDPRTGVGLTDHSQVSVVAEHGMQADALSKVLAVLGPEAGLALIEETPGAAAYGVRAPGERIEQFFSTRWKGLEAGAGEPEPAP